MAPELFLMDVDRSQLQKADIFSLGLTLYEAASLTSLPKNSFDGSLYEELRNGQLPYLSNYSKRFNHLISSMIQSKPSERPTASKLIKQVSIMNKKSEIQLCKELRASQRRLEELQNLLNNSYWLVDTLSNFICCVVILQANMSFYFYLWFICAWLLYYLIFSCIYIDVSISIYLLFIWVGMKYTQLLKQLFFFILVSV